ncbi:NUDIX domain-containing protein [Bacillus sp. FJAT-29790]|uniref:(deoxy)nucleoside triphosphate pyrophosphohydrolase n=1 Tax=Bacillus sp. FJAT-29790 TaxID=1895002 RepID=UPI001C23E13F|nr:NUDIX domain-containing protein [Bacillus sp. FJAT-29790]
MKKAIYVVGAVIIQNDKILCAQRGQSKVLPLKWEFPGGKIEQGETPQEALRREINEELHCKIDIGEQIDYTYQQMKQQFYWKLQKLVTKLVRLFFVHRSILMGGI